MKDYIREILEEVNDIQVRYTKPLLERNYTDRDYAIGRYEKLICKMIDIINNLQKENILLTNARYSLDRVKLEDRIDKAIELLEKENYHCPMSLTVEKAYIIEVEKINNVISILRGEDK